MVERVIDGVVLVTGAGSGIGAAMAARFHARGARVIVSGRDRARLESMAARHPGMSVVAMDVADPGSVTRGMAEVTAEVPHLTTLVNSAGIQRLLDFSAAEPPGPSDVAAEIATNLTGLIDVTAAALPLLRRAPRSRVVHIGSGLGFVPLAAAPVYSATKAAVHSFATSLRRQLATSTVQVVEIIAPVVDTPLHRDLGSVPPMAMPLDDFVDRAMRGLDAGKDEVAIGLGRVSRIGARVAPKRLFSIMNSDDRVRGSTDAHGPALGGDRCASSEPAGALRGPRLRPLRPGARWGRRPRP
ncbi:SDR family NAD(P)-dependent oxidoreductase [Geodermatophilus normandii]|uniref:SDR family NAD(P)-dependent oxidoreductase n=1 Tax=Geodermatophilus normandii TaxID=1137989 RepID=A0A6P0GLM7_9ACTN|nr:SDR family NAD(P)-dependent oxidoreductase [Geodermatophilus normandii]